MTKKYVSYCLNNKEELSKHIIEGNISSVEYFEYFNSKLTVDAFLVLIKQMTEEQTLKFFHIIFSNKKYMWYSSIDLYKLVYIAYTEGKMSYTHLHENYLGLLIPTSIDAKKISKHYIKYLYKNLDELLKYKEDFKWINNGAFQQILLDLWNVGKITDEDYFDAKWTGWYI